MKRARSPARWSAAPDASNWPGGTLLLDEIGEMPIGTQAKLLRVLEERKLRRLGARTEQDVDVRVLAATNAIPGSRHPWSFARGSLLPAQRLPHPHAASARAHRRPAGDGRAMVHEMNQKHARHVSGSRSRSRSHVAYGWPGNARELRNTIERAVILARMALRSMPAICRERSALHRFPRRAE